VSEERMLMVSSSMDNPRQSFGPVGL